MNDSGEMILVEADDDDFAAMVRGDELVRTGLARPPGGVAEPEILAHVRRLAAKARSPAQRGPGLHWLMVRNGEVVGLAGFKAPPSAAGEVELGYSVAASRRRRGYATAAVRAVIENARRDPAIRTIVASTAIENIGSQRALKHNGFEQLGTRRDLQDGEPLLLWQKHLEPNPAAHPLRSSKTA